MNKMDDAWAVVKKLPLREQKRAAAAILDFAASLRGPRLTAEQAAEVKRRLAGTNTRTMTAAQASARLRKLAR